SERPSGGGRRTHDSPRARRGFRQPRGGRRRCPATRRKRLHGARRARAYLAINPAPSGGTPERTASFRVGWSGSRNSLVEGRLSALQPPPSALTRSAAATIRRPRISTAVISLLSAVVWATMTFR